MTMGSKRFGRTVLICVLEAPWLVLCILIVISLEVNNQHNNAVDTIIRFQAGEPNISQVVSQSTQFSTSFFQVLGEKVGPSENLLISPFSVASVLAMIHVGAKGYTASQIKDSLQLSSYPDEKMYLAFGNLVKGLKIDEKMYSNSVNLFKVPKQDDDFTCLESVNQIYIEKTFPLAGHFQITLNGNFWAPAKSVDFIRAFEDDRIAINKQFEDFARSKIKEVFDYLPTGLDFATKLVIVNGFYYKEEWLYKFNPKYTEQWPFYLGSMNNQINVPMMFTHQRFRMGHINELDATVLELPYKGKRMSMFIILPQKIDGLADLETKLSRNNKILNKIDEIMTKKREPVMVHIPKFKIDLDLSVKDVLVELGIKDLFDKKLADLSGISGRKHRFDVLYCSEVYHKSFIGVNEEGSIKEASKSKQAATGGVLRQNSTIDVGGFTTNFVVDHPAIFFIRDNYTKLILFIGRLFKPVQHKLYPQMGPRLLRTKKKSK